MAQPRRAIILSDLHLGPGGALATFRDDAALSGFLQRLSAADAPPTELILAGDCFDFLQTDG
jgi:UDP-2,3-diacylglucosamine pyrophosphatase LpxH